MHCEGLTKRYDEITALDHLDLTIARGEVFGYIGHNGAGKTTTIRILAGLLEPTEGRARVVGTDVVAQRGRIKSLVGYMPDHFGVYDQMRVWEYLDFFGAAFKLPRRARRERIDYVLDVADAEYMRDRFVDTLSRGMKQRVGIARTLMHDPQVLLLDEPASGLDPKARIQMRQLLRRLADSGKTLLVSSHILPELAAICDSIGIIHKGTLRAAGPIHTVLSELRRDRLMELRAASGAEAAADVVDADDRCAQLDRTDATNGLLRFRFKGDDEQLAGLVAQLTAGGVRIVTFREVPLSLEDAYMAVSGLGPEEEQEEAERATPAADGAPTPSEQPR
ncbi:MAG: ABC transporter ATP-binding protein [Phycisphaerae bacterium]|nr:ABC transporter ATP-binding protein [Phycisphaerae bacterium]